MNLLGQRSKIWLAKVLFVSKTNWEKIENLEAEKAQLWNDSYCEVEELESFLHEGQEHSLVSDVLMMIMTRLWES